MQAFRVYENMNTSVRPAPATSVLLPTPTPVSLSHSFLLLKLWVFEPIEIEISLLFGLLLRQFRRIAPFGSVPLIAPLRFSYFQGGRQRHRLGFFAVSRYIPLHHLV